MQRVSPNEFQLLLQGPHQLTTGYHQFKFVVDGQWRCADDQPTMRDEGYNENHVIEIKMPQPVQVPY
jgi:hypothetical protein